MIGVDPHDLCSTLHDARSHCAEMDYSHNPHDGLNEHESSLLSHGGYRILLINRGQISMTITHSSTI